MLISPFACFSTGLAAYQKSTVISCTSLDVNFTFCMQFTGEVISVVVDINITGLYLTVNGGLRQLS